MRDTILKPNGLFADGGVIQSNPSPYGGTWAWCRTNGRGWQTECGSGITIVGDLIKDEVTNNQTEMIAIVKGLISLPRNWFGTIYTDSEITLGRLTKGYKWTNIPPAVQHAFEAETKRLKLYSSFSFVLLKGHPTKKQLEAGFTEDGTPVSYHNVWCDKVCKSHAQSVMELFEYYGGQNGQVPNMLDTTPKPAV